MMALRFVEQDERLVIVDFHDVEFEEPPPAEWLERINLDQTEFDLTTSRFRRGVPSPRLDDAFDPSRECRVTIYANDRITSEGVPTRLMLHWLAHGLLE
jgi:hypothetical protein